MKTQIRILLLLSGMLFFLAAKAQYTQIPDPNFEQALIDLGIDDVMDGQVLTASVEIIEYLDVRNKSVISLAGIEAFVSLKQLYAGGNLLESINTSTMPDLEILEAMVNEIEYLDLTQNTMLKKLLFNNNRLTSIDLSNNQKLEELVIGANQLTEIDVSNNLLLRDLFLMENQLASIDVTNNSLLERLILRNCGISNIDLGSNHNLILVNLDRNNLINLDLSNNIKLEALLIQDIPLTTIDLSNNGEIKVFAFSGTPISSFDFSILPKLEQVGFSRSSIQQIDLSSNQHLWEVTGSWSSIESLNLKNGMNHLITDFRLNSNPNLTCIQVDDAAYSTTNWTNIDPHMHFSEDCNGGGGAYTLIPDPNFEQALIDLGLDDVMDGQVLTASIDTVTVLNVENKNIGDLTGINAFTSLIHFGCGYNQLTSLNMLNLPNLMSLGAYHNQLTTLNLDNLPNVKLVDVTGNQFGELDLSNSLMLEQFYCVGSGLTSLNLSDCQNLFTVTCYGNEITNVNIDNCISLKSLGIFDNQLTSIDLSTNTSLESLGVWNNNLVHLDLSHNSNLTIVGCNSNQLETLNAKNGNNLNFTYFASSENPNLSCIQVDDAAWATANWTQIDPQSYFSEFCGGSVDDTDGDGVPDYADDYPNDPTRAFDNYFPAAGFGSLAFEDLWPGKGDYDFNDLVVDYRFQTVTNASNRVVEVFCTFVVKASGASLQNGFGFVLPDAAADFVTDPSKLMVSGYRVTEPFIELLNNGLEQGQSKPTIIVFDDVFNVLPHPGGSLGINTDPQAVFVPFDTISISMVPTGLDFYASDFSFETWNPFMIVDRNRGMEVHLPDYPPTDLADLSILGTYEDDSDPSAGRYYKTANNLPWAINIASTFTWPNEKVNITEAYSHFVAWAQSAGLLYNDWYMDKPGYRNEANIYEVP